MSNAVTAWNATVTGSAQSGTLSVILGLLFFGCLMLLGAWLANGLLDSYKAQKSTFKECCWYVGRYLALLTFFTYYFL